jgi:hypothetical protein
MRKEVKKNEIVSRVAHQQQIPYAPLGLTIFRLPVENKPQPTIDCSFSVGDAHPTKK